MTACALSCCPNGVDFGNLELVDEPPVTSSIRIDSLAQIVAAEGLTIATIRDLVPPLLGAERLQSWQAAGNAANLSYMQRTADIFVDPRNLLPDAQCMAIFAIPYSATPRAELQPNHGRIARYALGKDYHRVLKRRLEKVMLRLREFLGTDFNYRICSDSVPLLERAFAQSAELGFIGKNSMLIIPGKGSFFFLAEVLLALEVTNRDAQRIVGALPIVKDQAPREGHCGECTACLDSCPTAAFTAPRQLNAGRCISYLTIEKRGMLSPWERIALGEWLFGCDICQEVCPFNHTAMKLNSPPGDPEFQSLYNHESLSLPEVLAIRDDNQFLTRFAGTAIMRAKREGLVRNALCVVHNCRYELCLPTVEELICSDPSPVIRATATWTRNAFDGSRPYCELALCDSHEIVRAEASALLEGSA